jgi:hypothetical protein
MYVENKTKEQYLSEVSTIITNRNDLTKFRKEVIEPAIVKFNGKVLNARFTKAISSDEKSIYSKITSTNEHAVCISVTKYAQPKEEIMWLEIQLNNGGRIVGETEMSKKWSDGFDNTTSAYLSLNDNYDKYMETVVELKNAIEKFNDLPSVFRANIYRNAFTIHA